MRSGISARYLLPFSPAICYRLKRHVLLPGALQQSRQWSADAPYGENMRADIVMLVFRQGIHRIFGKHLVVAMLIGLTSRSVDPEADSNTAQDDGTDAATTQLQVQVRANEGSSLMLGDQVI
jgi:hypothetical protein